MKTDLSRDQITLIVERARHQRSVAAGDVITALTRRMFAALAQRADKLLHTLPVSPTAHQ